MNTRILLAAFASLLLGTIALNAQPSTDLRPDETVLFYVDSFHHGADPVYGKEISYAGFTMHTKNHPDGPEKITSRGGLYNVSDQARMDLYFPKRPNGQMVIICPGGGYSYTSTYNEGVYVAEWMIERGITVAVVKYRMPDGHSTVPAEDVENAFRYSRKHAAEWGITQIGIMGFSAGGHLAATISTKWTEPQTRPDFSVLIYPVITMEKGLTHQGTRENLITEKAEWHHHIADAYSLEKQVTRFTPTTFLALCSDDYTVPAENSLRYYAQLLDCNVPVEMHIWPSAGHGWGFSSERYVGKGNDGFAYARKAFESSLERWLEAIR